MSQEHCPNCNSSHIYQDHLLWICPECFHEWEENSSTPVDGSEYIVQDAYGNRLQDGDSITIIKELKIKGSSSSIKIGTKVKNIKIYDAGNGHNISCRVDGIGDMNLKSEFVKKAN